MKNNTATISATATQKISKENQHFLAVGQEVLVFQPAVWLVYGDNGEPIFGVTEHWIKTVITAVNHDPDDWFIRVERGAQLSPDWNQDEFGLEEIEFSSGGEIRLKVSMD